METWVHSWAGWSGGLVTRELAVLAAHASVCTARRQPSTPYTSDADKLRRPGYVLTRPRARLSTLCLCADHDDLRRTARWRRCAVCLASRHFCLCAPRKGGASARAARVVRVEGNRRAERQPECPERSDFRRHCPGWRRACARHHLVHVGKPVEGVVRPH